MSASLVGSEMCIRDSIPNPLLNTFDSQFWEHPSEIRLASELKARDSARSSTASPDASELNIYGY
eukprot:12090229-Alexandrium_andersonii.AAC.1